MSVESTLPSQESVDHERVRSEHTADVTRLAALSIGHAVIDSYGHTLIAPMFPLLKERLELSFGQIGALPIVMGLTASLAQPLIGLATDRWPSIPAVALGPAIAAIFIGFVSIAPTYA